MASISHWGMFRIDFAPSEIDVLWRSDLSGFVIFDPGFHFYGVVDLRSLS